MPARPSHVFGHCAALLPVHRQRLRRTVPRDLRCAPCAPRSPALLQPCLPWLTRLCALAVVPLRLLQEFAPSDSGLA
eukprot:2460646-Alexandrium_andersonii.AAC.1